MFSLKGMTAAITGGTSGIGEAVAARFVAAGARVVIIGRRDGAEVARKVGAVAAVRADCSQEREIARALQEARNLLGEDLDVLVNNAGIENTGPMIADATGEELNRIFAINTFAVFHGLKYGQALLKDGASVINTASIAADLGVPGYSQYSASKAAVLSLTRSAAVELAPRKIRVNSVCPGSVFTPMLPLDHPEVPLTSRMCPLGRIGTTDDVVGVYHFLASRESSYISGQALAVDGGLLAGVSLGTLEAVAMAAGG
ncbi:MAG: SDR family oxidoreductase [Steroidobacteraceae bacterium]|jgi:NAD(P)-dependent dehydrogenase (short-subunit alcohol dehydrogenase family)|nr:SDR family oxidoreductase [Pseudomonadota bacterium]MBP7610612.1 SDR family oxidoreductase [Steroidobacteraceae bacterium]MBP9128654.1 SDR family oxidoreductase [Steroidobacteraceae bacterium]